MPARCSVLTIAGRTVSSISPVHEQLRSCSRAHRPGIPTSVGGTIQQPRAVSGTMHGPPSLRRPLMPATPNERPRSSVSRVSAERP